MKTALKGGRICSSKGVWGRISSIKESSKVCFTSPESVSPVLWHCRVYKLGYKRKRGREGGRRRIVFKAMLPDGYNVVGKECRGFRVYRYSEGALGNMWRGLDHQRAGGMPILTAVDLSRNPYAHHLNRPDELYCVIDCLTSPC